MMGSLAAFVVALFLGATLSRVFLRSLIWLVSREHKVGKEKIHRLFPKPRRPLGGGLAMMLGATVGTALCYALSPFARVPVLLWTLGLAWVFALIGLADDLRKTRGRGMKDKAKLALQVLAASVYGFLVWRYAHLDTVAMPFGEPLALGTLYPVFAGLVIVATANAVNLADGVDGLAGGAAVCSLLGFVLLGAIDPQRAAGPVVWPLLGAILGFLTRNLPPGKILMGDTGALGIGAALASLALFTQSELWLLLMAAPFVVDAASVVVQMGTVRGLWKLIKPLRHRTTETARPFLCTPLHHHFQWLGWSDWRILALFWGFGLVMAVWAGLSRHSGVLWLVGVLALVAFLLAASLQKWFRAGYFLGLLSRPDQPRVVALYRGLPSEVLVWPLYRVHSETAITEGMLVGATAESMLWRPLTEVEAHIVLGRIYADHRLFDQARYEWEQVPTRNLLLRPSVVLRLARIYYGGDRLLEAIKLWEQLPGSRLEEMPNVREVVRNARLRLADLASKSYRQGLRMLKAATRSAEGSEQVEAHLLAARRFNQDLLSLLLYEWDKLRGRRADPQAARERRELLRQTRTVVMRRLEELDGALTQLARSAPSAEASDAAEGSDPAERAAHELRIDREELIALLSSAGRGRPQVTRAAIHPKDSRNLVCRLGLAWPETGAPSVVIKRYSPDRVAFFSGSYRRERGVLELLHGYGAAVPRVYGGKLGEGQALLVMQDLGDETLAERLEQSDARTKMLWLRSAVQALVDLQAKAHEHLRELAEEVQKVDKERLGQEYYLRAVRIALERIAALTPSHLSEPEWGRVADQAQHLTDFLCNRATGFIHFELTPHHFLVTERGLQVFDFEQATVGPQEFDLATILAQPESQVGGGSWETLLGHYQSVAAEAGLPATEQFERGVDYAALFKCLVYAGAAVHFLGRFGGEHHLQRFHYYLEQCQAITQRWPPLRPLGALLLPRLRAARNVVSSRTVATAREGPG